MKSAVLPTRALRGWHRLLPVLTLAGIALPAAVHAATLTIDSVTVETPQQTATVCADLAGQGDVVAGVQNDLVWDDRCMEPAGRCRANPSHGKTLSSNQLSTTTLRALLLSLSDVDPIPDGELYCCDFQIKITEPGRCCTLQIQGARASDPRGGAMTLAGRDGKVCLARGPAGGQVNKFVPNRQAPNAAERGPEQGVVPPREKARPPLESPPEPAAEPAQEAAGRAESPELRTGGDREIAGRREPAAESPGATPAAAGKTLMEAQEAAAPASPARTPASSVTARVTRSAAPRKTPRTAATHAPAAAQHPSPEQKDSGCRITGPGTRPVFPIPLFLLGLAFVWAHRRAAAKRDTEAYSGGMR